MKLLIAGLLMLTAQAVGAADALRFDLICNQTKSFAAIDNKRVELKAGETERISIDLRSKLWCARFSDGKCGTTAPLSATATKISLNQSLIIDRRSGVMTMESQVGPMISIKEFACLKTGFTTLPATKF